MKDLKRSWHKRPLKPQKHSGQDKKKKADSKSTGLTGHSSGLTGSTGLTGLTGASSKPGNTSGAKNKKGPSFKELLAKYEKEGIAQKQKEKLNEAKDSKPSSKHQEQSDSHPSQGNCMTFNGPITPWYCYYPYFYTLMDYSMMYMIFNIVLCIQIILLHEDRLLLTMIWSKKILIAAKQMRRAWSKIQNIYSRGGVPQTCLTPKREGCNGCARRSPWNNKWRLY